MITNSLWGLSRKTVGEAELGLGDHHHTKGLLWTSTLAKYGCRMKTWVPSVFYFLSSFAIPFFLLTAGNKVAWKSTVHKHQLQMSSKGGGLLVSALLQSLKPLSFILFYYCKSASPSLFLPSRSLCVPYNIKLFKI